MADDRTAHAIDVVARNAAWLQLDQAVLLEKVEWSEYPELGEHDWNAVDKRIQQLADSLKPDLLEFEAAYDFLKGRANDDG